MPWAIRCRDAGRDLAPRRQWDEILAVWKRFLELHPQSADGYLERAGTYLAFQEKPLLGVAALFIPIVWVFYLFSRWRKAWPCIMLAIGGAIIFFAAGGTIPT